MNLQHAGSDSTSETDEVVSERKDRGFASLSYAPVPAPDQIVTDDEHRLLREVSDDAGGVCVCLCGIVALNCAIQ